MRKLEEFHHKAQQKEEEEELLIGLLMDCAKQKDVHRGSRIHEWVITRGLLERNPLVGSALVNMYAKCGALEKAQEVFDKLSARDTLSWNFLILGYARHGHGDATLKSFVQMQAEGVSPDAVTFTNVLKACGTIGASDKGQEIHDQIIRDGTFENDIHVGTALIDMYGKCGLLEKAQDVFDKLQVRDVVSWTALIVGYAQHGHGEEALSCFEQMQYDGISPNAVTLICVLKACGIISALDKGQQVHALIIKVGLLERDIYAGTAIVDMYVKCGMLGKALEVFSELQERNVVLWTALIAGCVYHGHGEEALYCFQQMQQEDVSPNKITYIFILRACGIIVALDRGQETHAQITKVGLQETEIQVGTALVDMYSKCGMLGKALEMFHKLPVRDVVSWTALIIGYAQHGHGEEALQFFEGMEDEGLSPDGVTIACLLKACGSIGAFEKGHKLHAKIVSEGFLEKDVVVANALVDMYVKSGFHRKAAEVFYDLRIRNTVSWNTIIAGHVQHELNDEALSCFEQMELEGFSPDAATFACVLKACGSIGAVHKGQEVHSQIVQDGLLEEDILFGMALVDMYAKCGGLLLEAQYVFDKLPIWDVVLWNTIMAGYSKIGKDDFVFEAFSELVQQGKEPDSVTFTILLNTCSHRGLVEKGQLYFEMLSKSYGIIPTSEHYTCIVDVFARAGHLNQAAALIKEIPFPADFMLWHTLLVGCQKWGNSNLGSWVFNHTVQFLERNAAAYVNISNIYAAAAGRQEDADTFEVSGKTEDDQGAENSLI